MAYVIAFPKSEAGVPTGSAMYPLPPSTRLLGIGFYIATCVIGGIVLGVFLDYVAGTRGLFTILFMLIGLAVAFYGVYRMLQEATKPGQGRKE